MQGMKSKINKNAALFSLSQILKRVKYSALFIALYFPVFVGFVIIIMLGSNPKQILCAKLVARQLY
jgi:hypothetical protein